MKFLFNELIKPLVHRLGSHTGVLLSGLGMSQADVGTVQAAAVILGGFAVDFLVRKVL